MDYFAELEAKTQEALRLATEARAKGLDSAPYVEIRVARDLAGRVEGLLGYGLEDYLREKLGETSDRVKVAFEIAREIAQGEVKKASEQALLEMAVRTGLAVLTDGVAVAPTEGIVEVRIDDDHAAVSYAGPIRGAGGTPTALSVALADAARRELGLGRYIPSEKEVERFVEEVNLYDSRLFKLQYKPSDETVRWIIKNCPIFLDGEPTGERLEVSATRDLPRFRTNRVRTGVPLVICEGIAQKAKKLAKLLKKVSLEWPWLEKIKREKGSGGETWIDGVVSGRPILSYENARGGFRLRYGRTPMTGIMAKAVHPALFVLLDGFLTAGTQLRLELPGKGCILTPCDSLEPPLVKLKDGSVVRVETVAQAEKLRDQVEEILFLGDLLCPVGDFLKGGNEILPSPFVEEWWEEEVKAKGLEVPEFTSAEEAFEFARRTHTPLHPRYLLYWSDLTPSEMVSLVDYWGKARIEDGRAHLPLSSEKRLLEILGVPHRVLGDEVVLDEEWTYVLLQSLPKEFDGNDVLGAVSKKAGVEIRQKSTKYIGARMGRPEKAERNQMEGRINVLFPTGIPKQRDLLRTAEASAEAELRRFHCPKCGRVVAYPRCPFCGTETEEFRVCQVCGRPVKAETHCGKPTLPYDRRPTGLKEYLDFLKKKFGSPAVLRGPEGLFSSERQPERLEKGFLRGRHGVLVFKDGTSRFDGTDIPLTHFRPQDIGVSVERLRQLGYEKDVEGKELTRADQVLELLPQDVIIPEAAGEYFVRVAKFIDDLLEEFYGLPAFYRVEKREDLLGHLAVAMSPHTSAGVLCRIIGFTKFQGILAHPYLHCAKRRNCDGDEDAVFLLLDALLNFSRHYLPSSRGGTMGTPIVLMTKVVPTEVDDEVHEMEVNWKYPLEFYEGTLRGEVRGIKQVKHLLKTSPYSGFGFTHPVKELRVPPKSTYRTLKSTAEKIRAQMALHSRIRAVDENDAAARLLTSHLLPDIYGNLRAFGRQTFRCSKCNAKYRRVPLSGKCKCGGDIILSVTRGGIEKYLGIALELAEKYEVPDYLRQRLLLLKKEISMLFSEGPTLEDML